MPSTALRKESGKVANLEEMEEGGEWRRVRECVVSDVRGKEPGPADVVRYAIGDVTLYNHWEIGTAYSFRPTIEFAPVDAVPEEFEEMQPFVLYSKEGDDGGEESNEEVRAVGALLSLTQNVHNNIVLVGGVCGIASYPEARRRKNQFPSKSFLPFLEPPYTTATEGMKYRRVPFAEFTADETASNQYTALILPYGGAMEIFVFAYEDSYSRSALLRYIGLHADQIEAVTLINPPTDPIDRWGGELYREALANNFFKSQVARIITVESLEGLVFPRNNSVPAEEVLSITLHVSDHMCEWNDGKLFTFTMKQADRVLHVVQSQDVPTDADACYCEVTITGLTALVYGAYTDMSELMLRGWCTAKPRAVQVLSAMFASQQCSYFTTYF